MTAVCSNTESRVRAVGVGINPPSPSLNCKHGLKQWRSHPLLPGLNSPVLRLVRVKVPGDVWSAWRTWFGTPLPSFRFHLERQNSTKSQSEVRVIASLFSCQVFLAHMKVKQQDAKVKTWNRVAKITLLVWFTLRLAVVPMLLFFCFIDEATEI